MDRGLYQRVAEALAYCDLHQSPAEMHGVICGFVASGATTGNEQLMSLLTEHTEIATDWPPPLQQEWISLRDTTLAGLTSDSLSLVLLLPEADASLAEHISCLGEWSDGFLAGFATGHALHPMSLGEDVQEALEDLVAISQIGIGFEDGNDAACRSQLEEIAEHCRMSAILVFTELALKLRADRKMQH